MVIPCKKSVYLDPCLEGNQWKLHPSVKIYLPKCNLPRPSGGGFSPLADLSKHEHSQLLKTISNWVSEHPRVTRCHKKNWKMIKPCMDGRTRPTWLISHQLWCSPAGGEKKKKQVGGAVGTTSSCHRWKPGRQTTMHKSLRRPLLTQVGTQISTSTLQRKLIFNDI